MDRAAFANTVHSTSHGRKGPIFIEIPLDIQGRDVSPDSLTAEATACTSSFDPVSTDTLDDLARRLRVAKRPVLLIGGGISRTSAAAMLDQLAKIGIPLMTTWNGIDRIPADHPLYFGRPNTWGQRSANILLQQADLLV